MLIETLATDPETARRILKPLIGAVIPIVAGAPTENFICKFNAQNKPADTTTPIFESSNKIGIGTTSPTNLLTVAGNGRITGALLLGAATATKQGPGGPELITAMPTAINNIILWSGISTRHGWKVPGRGKRTQ